VIMITGLAILIWGRVIPGRPACCEDLLASGHRPALAVGCWIQQEGMFQTDGLFFLLDVSYCHGVR